MKPSHIFILGGVGVGRGILNVRFNIHLHRDIGFLECVFMHRGRQPYKDGHAWASVSNCCPPIRRGLTCAVLSDPVYTKHHTPGENAELHMAKQLGRQRPRSWTQECVIEEFLKTESWKQVKRGNPLAKPLHQPHGQKPGAWDRVVTRLAFLQNASSAHNPPSLPLLKS